MFRDCVSYRATGIVLSDILPKSDAQLDLFGAVLEAGKVSCIYDQIDLLSERYGKHVVFLGSSFRAITGVQYTGARGESVDRKQQLFKGEGERKRVGIPMMGEVR